MATTSLWRVKGYIGKLILYASDPEKTTDNRSIETGNDDTTAFKSISSEVGNFKSRCKYPRELKCGL